MDLAKILLLFEGDASGAVKAIDTVHGGLVKVGETSKSAGGFLNGAGGMFAGLAVTAGIGAVVAVIGKGVQAAAEFQKAQVGLNQALADAGIKATPGLEAAEAKMRKLGHTDTDTVGVIQSLVQAGVPWNQALSALGPIADLAAAKHLDLASATHAVIVGAQGSGRELKSLGITLPTTIATTKQLASANAAVAKAQQAVSAAMEKVNTTHGPAHQKALEALAKAQQKLHDAQKKVSDETAQQGNKMAGLGSILDQLNQKVGGQAQAAAGTLPGLWARITASFDHAAVTFGDKLLPTFERFSKWVLANQSQIDGLLGGIAGGAAAVANAIGFVADHFNVIGPLLGTIVGLWAAWNVGLAITKGLQMAQMAAQLVIGLVQIASKVGLVTIAQWLWNVAMDANPIGLVILAIAALIAIIILVATHWKQISGWLSTEWKAVTQAVGQWFSGLGTQAHLVAVAIGDAFQNAKNWIVQHFEEAVRFVENLPGRILRAAQAIGGAILNGITGALRGLGSAILGLIGFALKPLADLPGIGGAISGQFHSWGIPGFAEGGIVPGAVGSPQLILAHGGEGVFNQGQLAALGQGGNRDLLERIARALEAPPPSIDRNALIAAIQQLFAQSRFRQQSLGGR